MQTQASFKNMAIVSCGTLLPELSHLKKSGFLDAKKILYTTPGRHENPRELQKQLIDKIRIAKKYSDKIIVVYGGKFCYVNTDDPYQTIDKIIETQGPGIHRIQASHCIDMLASQKERERISNGKKVWWMTPGWLISQRFVFQDWDKGKAVENFPKHTGGAMVLDGINFFDHYVAEHPEDLLEFSDWMGIPIESYKISLDRLKSLLLDQIHV